jgi:hypothetical protein
MPKGPIALLVGGAILLFGGVFGIYYQGLFWVSAVPGPVYYTPDVMALGLPAGVTLAGSFVISWGILASPLSAAWTPSKRCVVFTAFAVGVLAASAFAAWRAALIVERELRTTDAPSAVTHSLRA